jgi:hypothetical protein
MILKANDCTTSAQRRNLNPIVGPWESSEVVGITMNKQHSTDSRVTKIYKKEALMNMRLD